MKNNNKCLNQNKIYLSRLINQNSRKQIWLDYDLDLTHLDLKDDKIIEIMWYKLFEEYNDGG